MAPALPMQLPKWLKIWLCGSSLWLYNTTLHIKQASNWLKYYLSLDNPQNGLAWEYRQIKLVIMYKITKSSQEASKL